MVAFNGASHWNNFQSYEYVTNPTKDKKGIIVGMCLGKDKHIGESATICL